MWPAADAPFTGQTSAKLVFSYLFPVIGLWVAVIFVMLVDQFKPSELIKRRSDIAVLWEFERELVGHAHITVLEFKHGRGRSRFFQTI